MLFILVFLVVSDDGLGDGLSESHNLVAGTSTSNSALNVEVLELVSSKQEDWLVELELQRLWLNEINSSSINSNGSDTLGANGDGSGILLSSESLNTFLVFTHY